MEHNKNKGNNKCPKAKKLMRTDIQVGFFTDDGGVMSGGVGGITKIMVREINSLVKSIVLVVCCLYKILFL